MAETGMHRDLMNDLIFELETHFRNQTDVYISGNLLIYYVEGNPGKRVAPDVFLVRGVSKRKRRIYKLWEEGSAPDVIFEISSRQTWRDDLQSKWKLYEQLGVKEYFIFDPEYDYLKDEPLIGYRLESGQYEQLEIKEGRIHSDALGLDLIDTGETLRLFDPQEEKFLQTSKEAAETLMETQAELTRLRSELDRARQNDDSQQ